MATRSSLPRKQRAALYSSPLHVRHKMVSSRLSDELAGKLGRRSAPLRKGDKVKVMRGKSKGSMAKVDEVSLGRLRTFLEGITMTRVNGAKVRIPFHPSNLMIIELSGEDKERAAALARSETKSETTAEPKAEPKAAAKGRAEKANAKGGKTQ